MRRKYSFGVGVSSDWTPARASRPPTPAGIAIGEGEILEADPPLRLVHSFRALWSDSQARSTSRVTWEIEPVGGLLPLDVDP